MPAGQDEPPRAVSFAPAPEAAVSGWPNPCRRGDPTEHSIPQGWDHIQANTPRGGGRGPVSPGRKVALACGQFTYRGKSRAQPWFGQDLRSLQFSSSRWRCPHCSWVVSRSLTIGEGAPAPQSQVFRTRQASLEGRRRPAGSASTSPWPAPDC